MRSIFLKARTMKLSGSFVILLLLVNAFLVSGQTDISDIKFDNLSINDGLSQSSPNCIFQDSRGFLWIGTEDGLNKYDGYSFMIYKPVQDNKFSISNPRILSICEDRDGYLWIGTNGGGVNKYDRYNNRFYNYLPSKTGSMSAGGDVVRNLKLVSGSELWMATASGLSILNTTTGEFIDIEKNYPELKQLMTTPIRFISISDESVVWFGADNGFYRYNTKTKSLIETKEIAVGGNKTISVGQVNNTLTDQNQNLWIGTETGLALLEYGKDEYQWIYENTSNRSVKALLEDDEGNIWIGTTGFGIDIWSVQSRRLTNYSYDHNNPYSLSNNDVLSVFKDFSGIIWVGTNGLDKYNPKKEKFVLYDYVPYSAAKLVFRNIHPIYEDRNSTLWIGSKSDGLHILNREEGSYERWTHQPSNSNSLSSNKIRAILEYPEGVFWIGTEDQGLNKVTLNGNRRPVSFKHYLHQAGNSNSLTSNKIYALYADPQGKLWIGTDNGLTVMDTETETFKQYVPNEADTNSISNTTVYAIYGDSQGNIWLATDYGINRYNPSTDGFIHYTHDENNARSLIHNEILAFHEDAKGRLWIGTYGKGLDRLDPVTGDFTHFNNVDHLETGVIYGILEDESGNLWMSSNEGILKFNPENGEIKQFSVENGLQSNEYNGTSYFRSHSGEMFFGGQYGFNSFYPNNVIIDSIPPKIVLSDLQVRNISVVPGDKSPISQDISEAKEIVLRYRENNFTIYFSALQFANPSMNKYKYKLEGFDDEWIDVSNKRFVSYTSLPYRTYTFRVIASNSDGVWNEEGLSVKIRVKPPLWATIWFRIIMVGFIIWLAYYLITKRIKLAQEQKRIFEEKFDASTKELDNARQQLDKQHEEIVIQKRELIQREKDQENLLWFNQGLGIFSEIMSKNKDNIHTLCQITIQKLVEYVDAQQGGLFLVNEDDPDHHYLELIAHYAFSEEKINKRFEIGEGYVGTCFRENQFTEVDNLSDHYAELHSGLGKEYLKYLVLAPMKVNEVCIGVLEIGSFRKIKGYRISFIEKLLESFSSIINTERANIQLKKLIEHSRVQAEELHEREEQLRMNIEEITATQEESARREDELIKLAEESATREEILNQEIETLKKTIAEITGKPYDG